MEINAKEIIANDLKDKNYSENKGITVSNITAATFVNTIAYENGVKVNFEDRGINTSLENAQVITKDKTIEQIDTTLHTDMLNKDVRQNFVIDFLKTTSLVPQVAKGIGQGISADGYNVFGQLANNLGKNGFDIVAYATGADEKLKNIITNHLNGKGDLVLTDYNIKDINNILIPLLAEYGKDFYNIEYIKDEKLSQGMSINDKDGTVYINIKGQGFGHAGSMLEQLGHEGMHGTYANKEIDEKAAQSLTNYDKIGAGIGADISLVNGRIQVATDKYNEARANGDLRDVIVSREGIIEGKYEKDESRKEIFKQYDDFNNLSDEDFAKLIKYEPLSVEDESEYLSTIKQLSIDTWDVVEDSKTGRRRLEIVNKVSDEMLNSSSTSEVQRVVTLILREMDKDEYYFSLQSLSKEKKALDLSNEQIYDLSKKRKDSFVYLDSSIANDKYVVGYDVSFNDNAEEKRTYREETIGILGFTGHEIVGHGYDVIEYYKNKEKIPFGSHLILKDPKYYNNINKNNIYIDDHKNVFYIDNIFTSKVGETKYEILYSVYLREFNAVYIENLIHKSLGKEPRGSYLRAEDITDLYDNDPWRERDYFLIFSDKKEREAFFKEKVQEKKE